MIEMKDELTNPLSPQLPPSATPSPTKRSTRSSGNHNKVRYLNLTRATGTQTITYTVGDFVLISPELNVIPPWLKEPVIGKTKNKAKTTEQYWWETHDDGLAKNVKVAVVESFFRDEKGREMGTFRWFARPKYVFDSKRGPVDDDRQVHEQELYYTHDAVFAANPSKLPKTTDSLAIKFILATPPVKIISESIFNEISGRDKPKGKVFFVRRIYNTRPISGNEDWFYDLDDFSQMWKKCLSLNDWDVQCEVEGVDAEEEKEDIEMEVLRTPRKRKIKDMKVERTPRKRRRVERAPLEDVVSSSESERDSEQDDYEEFSSSDDDEESSDSEISRSSADDDSNDLDELDLDDWLDVSTPTRKNHSPIKRSPSKQSPSKQRLQHSPIKSIKIQGGAGSRKKREALNQRREARKARRLARGPPRLAFSTTHIPSFENLAPFQRAAQILHVSATPEFLPCREEEYVQIESFLEDAIDEGIGGCLYVAGVPGTGKTATVLSVVKVLQERAEQGEIAPFRFCEINGMKLTEPSQAFVSFWNFLEDSTNNVKIGPKQALKRLETYFEGGAPGRETCVVLVDELDQLITKKQEVIYNFFDWPNRPQSKLIVVAIANTMDLPEREFLGKIRSRLGNNRINFSAYTSDQLIKIVEARLDGLNVFEKDGIKLAAKKVASVTGDARRALDICRRTVENVDLFNSTSGKPPRLATAGDVVKTYAAMTNSGPLAFVRKMGVAQKVLLYGMIKEGRKRSAGDVEIGDIIRFYLQFTRQLVNVQIPALGHDDLLASIDSLANMRLIVLEPMPGEKRTGYFRRLKVVVSDEELEPVLREDGYVGRYFK